MAETPFRLWRIPITQGISRPATVAECLQAVSRLEADRTFGEWFFGLHRGHDREDVRGWLVREGYLKGEGAGTR